MTVNDFIIGIAQKLKSLYPTRHVFVDEIPAKADGNHFVHCTDQRHGKKLGRRRSRSYSFEVLYFKAKKDNMAFNDWAEQMYFEFEALDVSGQIVHLTNAHAQDGDDMVFHFIFDAEFTALIDQVSGDPMNTLQLTEGLKI